MNISGNNISGEIPPSISDCGSLTSVDFSRNSLHGEIPRGISQLRVLSILNLSRNQLTGPIPSEIRDLTSLTTLDLSYNDFVSRIPTDGQFLVFNETSFARNPNLCLPHNFSCLSLANSTTEHSGHNHKAAFCSLEVVISIIAIFAAFLLLI
ncbi:hypothetical protein ACOSQ2_011459 [Xanthoceras sorbifolium]